jgi:putative ABC transport system permease protein
MITDLRYALRQLSKAPGFTFLAVLTLGLGIGANTAIFSVINAVLLRPLPYPDPNRVVIVTESEAEQPSISVSFPDYLDWKKENRVFEELAVTRRESYNLSGLPGRSAEQVSGAIVTANFFKVIGLKPHIGRVFTEEEDRAGGPPLAVISDSLWKRAFQSDPAVLGRAVNFGGQPYTIIGVMPPQMFSPRTVEVWFPLMRRATTTIWTDRENHPGLFGWGRLKPGVSLEQADSEMKAIASRLSKLYPATNSRVGATVTLLLENQIGEYRSSLTLLFAAVGVVLLICCANLANLLAARGAARTREFGIRVAIGASRWQIIRQLLTESLLLALLGGAFGLALAAWGRDLLVALAPAGSRRFQETTLDGWVIAFTAALSIATSVFFGLWPAWTASRADAQLALRSGSHGSSDAPAARRSRELLIVAEVAMTLVLLTTAALVLRSFSRTMALSLGFDTRNLLTARVDLPSPRYEDEKRLRVFSDALLGKLKELPGVEVAALAANPPFMTGWQDGFLPEGMPEPPPGQQPGAEMAVISDEYFATIGTPILRGRSFQPNDTENAPPILIVDQGTVDKYFPGQDPIGKRIRIRTDDSGPKMRTIVGVVPRLKVYGFDEPPNPLPQFYLPLRQQPQNGLVILLRTSLAADAFEKPLREIVTSLDPAQPVFEVRTMQSLVAETWATPRLVTFLLSIFAGLALLLAIVGLYGVMAYNGVRRMREIGVRLALGACQRQIVVMMLRQGMRLLVIGLAIGLAAALALSQVIRGLLFEISPTDPLTYFVVASLLAVAAVVACWIPARRASRVDPIITLRAE